MKRLVNNTIQPQMLEDGTSLAASGTQGSERLVESISERDEKRLVRSGKVSAYESSAAPVAGDATNDDPAGKTNSGRAK